MTIDEQWAEIIRWLQSHRVIMHIPKDKPVWFEHKPTGLRVLWPEGWGKHSGVAVKQEE